MSQIGPYRVTQANPVVTMPATYFTRTVNFYVKPDAGSSVGIAYSMTPDGADATDHPDSPVSTYFDGPAPAAAVLIFTLLSGTAATVGGVAAMGR